MDRFDTMAEISGKAAGLAPSQWPGLAHIFRALVTGERTRCATIASRFSAQGDWDVDTAEAIAASILSTEELPIEP